MLILNCMHFLFPCFSLRCSRNLVAIQLSVFINLVYRVVVGGKSSWYQLALSVSIPSWIHFIPHAERSTFSRRRIHSKGKFGENVKPSIWFVEVFSKLFIFFIFLQSDVCNLPFLAHLPRNAVKHYLPSTNWFPRSFTCCRHYWHLLQ